MQPAMDFSTEQGPDHAYYMRQALLMGERALQTNETPVGCVLVYAGEVIGSGMNDTNRSMNGTRHAEFVAIEEVLQSHPSTKYEAYTSVAQTSVLGALEAFCRYILNPAYPVYGGLFNKEAIMLLRRFYIQENEKAPNPRPKKNRELNTKFDDDV